MKRLIAFFLFAGVLVFGQAPNPTGLVYTTPPSAASLPVSLSAYGAVCNGVTDDSAAFTAAEAANANISIPKGTGSCLINPSASTFTLNSNYLITSGGTIGAGSGKTVTINGTITAPAAQIFSGSGTFKIGSGTPVAYAEWWGAKGDNSTDDTTALSNCVNNFTVGGTCQLLAKVYKTTTNITMSVSATGFQGLGVVGGPTTVSTRINNNSATSDIIDMSGGYLLGQFVKNLTLSKSVTVTNAGAIGLDAASGYWATVDNVQIIDVPTGLYMGGAADSRFTFMQVYWTSLSSAGITQTGYNLNGASNWFSTLQAYVSGYSGTTVGAAFNGAGLSNNTFSDVWLYNFQTNSIKTGILIDATACASNSGNECGNDIHIINPVLNATTTGISFVNLNNAFTSCGGCAPPSIDIDGGSYLLGTSAPSAITFSNSSEGYTIEHFNVENNNSFSTRESPIPFASASACNASWEGSTYPILDSTTSTSGATITGGGSNHVFGYCNGTNWVVASGVGGASGGTTNNAPQYDVPYYSSAGTTNTLSGAAIAGLQFDSTSGAPTAATAAQIVSAIGSAAVANATSAAGLSATLASGSGGTGVANTATLTLGTSNINFATQATGVDYNTTTTGAQTAATGHQIEVPHNCADSSGSGTAQSCNTSPTFTPASPDCVTYTTTTTNSGTGLTTNINSLGAKSIAIAGSSGWTTTLTAGIIPANKPQVLCYDGTNWDDMQTGTAAGGSGTPSFPVTVAGTVNSGGIPYFNSSTQESSSAALAANVLVKGGGAGVAPSGSSITDNGTTISTSEPVAIGTATCTTFGTAGGICPAEGTAPTNVSGAAPIYADNTQHEFLAATNGSSSYGMLVRRQPGAIKSTGLTASVSTATLCAATAGACNVAGQYHVHISAYQTTVCTANTTNGLSISVFWTDPNGVARGGALPLGGQNPTTNGGIWPGGVMVWQLASLLAAGIASVDFNVDTNATTGITYSTTYVACTTGTATYSITGSVERIQ